MKNIHTWFLKFFARPAAPRRTLRSTLRELHTTGTIRVFRGHSLFHLWAPHRESFDAEENFVG